VTLDDYADVVRDGWESVQRFVGFWGPVVAVPASLRPLAAVGTLISLLAITGVALGSLALFVTSVLFLYLLLSRIFGIEISLRLP
jgi:hypothetical protein